MLPTNDDESVLYGLKLFVDRYGDAVTNILQQAEINVIQSPSCYKVLHTSFNGSFKELIEKIPELANYPIKQYRWWLRLAKRQQRD